MKKSDYIAGLRELANYLEVREFPETIKGFWEDQAVFEPFTIFFNARNKEDFGKLCAAFGSFEKERDNYSTAAKVTLSSGFSLKVSTDRSNVCKRIVVGTRTIEAKPERVEVIEAEPERTEEIVEWECPESFIALGKNESV